MDRGAAPASHCVLDVLFVAGVAGIVCIISGLVEPGVVPVVLGGLNLAADARYVARAFAACRRPSGTP
jgi:hypothetical protein